MVPAEVLLVRNMIAPFIENSAIMHKVVSIDLTVINLHHVLQKMYIYFCCLKVKMTYLEDA